MSSISETTVDGGHRGRVWRWLVPHQLPQPINPALLKHREERARDVQNRVADRITTFSGSMTFVYLHIVWFGLWIGLGVEKYPFGLLTMIVSLEAIFLSTFVMISQNRADAKRQVVADEQWQMVQAEDQQNEELLEAVQADPRADEGSRVVHRHHSAGGQSEPGAARSLTANARAHKGSERPIFRRRWRRVARLRSGERQGGTPLAAGDTNAPPL